jgi:hypothetical protein
MPKVSKQSAEHDDYGPVESWHKEVDGHAIVLPRRSIPQGSPRQPGRGQAGAPSGTHSQPPPVRGHGLQWIAVSRRSEKRSRSSR